MIEILHRSTAKLSIALLLIISLITLAAPSAAAFDNPENKSKEDIRDGSSGATGTAPAATASDARAVAPGPKISALPYVHYNPPSKLTPEIILPADQPQLDGILNRAV